MPRYHGIEPEPETHTSAVRFENEVMVRIHNRFLVATVYLDMEPLRWAVAIAYNPSRQAGLSGHDNVLEVRYAYTLNKRMTMTMMRSDPMEERTIPAGPFAGPDAFARHALECERRLLGRP